METTMVTTLKTMGKYTVISIPMEYSCSMNVYLPNASYSIDNILARSTDIYRFDSELQKVTLRMPLISILSNHHLTTMLDKMGCSSLFQLADFSNLINDASFSIGNIIQDSIFIADKKGVEAGAHTEIMYIGMDNSLH